MQRSFSANFMRKMPARSQSKPVMTNMSTPLQTLNLSHQNITEIPSSSPLVNKIDVSSNSLTALTDQMVSTLLSYNHLETLDLSDNLLVEFPNGLNGLQHLKELNLFYNRFQAVDVNIPNLEILNLGQNRLTIIPHLPPNLKSLSLDFNLIHQLDISIIPLVRLSLVLTELEFISPNISFPNLTHLDLAKNNLAAMPDLTKLAPKLEVLDISDNFLSEMPMPPLTIREYIIKSNLLLELPKNLSSLVNLRSLDASNNHIEFIPTLPLSIQSFIISQNQITRTTPCKTPNLKRLYIRNNKLSIYPQYEKMQIREYSGGFNRFTEIKPLWSYDGLTRVDFTHNNLTEIPIFIFKIPNLSILVLSKNKIRTVPSEIVKSSKLSTLNLSENPIETLPPLPSKILSLYVGFCRLRELPDMSGNDLLTIFAAPGNNLNSIPNAPRVKTMLLSRNRFSNFPTNMPLLIESLDLSFNLIQKVPSGLDLPSLDELDLSHNSITFFPSSTFKFPRLKFLRIGDNPISCKISSSSSSTSPLSSSPKSSSPKLTSSTKTSSSPKSTSSSSKISSSKSMSSSLSSSSLPTVFDGLELCDVTNTKIEFENEPSIRQLFVTQLLPQYRTRHVKQMSALPWLAFSEMKGVRETMEDSIGVNAFINGDVDLYLVADGHGGSKTSAFAALFLVDDFSKAGLKLSKRNVYQSVKRLNRSLRSRLFVDGSTIALALFNGRKLVTAHVGDSRILVVTKDGRVSFATVDHKSSDRGEYERVHLSGGRVSANRIHGILAPGRSLGDFNVPGKTDEPEIKVYAVNPEEDKWIIVGCDGVFDMLSNEEIASFLAARSENSAAELANDIKNLAYAEMSLDNISVVVVDIMKRKVPDGVEHINDDADDDVLPQIPMTNSFDDGGDLSTASFPSFGDFSFGSQTGLAQASEEFSPHIYNNIMSSSPLSPRPHEDGFENSTELSGNSKTSSFSSISKTGKSITIATTTTFANNNNNNNSCVPMTESMMREYDDDKNAGIIKSKSMSSIPKRGNSMRSISGSDLSTSNSPLTPKGFEADNGFYSLSQIVDTDDDES